MKAVFLDFGSLAADRLDPSPLLDTFPGIRLHDSTPDNLLVERIDDAACVLANKSPLDAAVLSATPAVRYIGLAATGTDNVDTDYAAGHGIAVTNIRSYCTSSVVEHVFGALLTLTHSLDRYRAAVRAGHWQASPHFSMLTYPLRELPGLTLGIVGFGELGRAVARIAEGFGMRILVSRRPGMDDDRREGRVDFEELLEAADVISLHCPLTDATAGLFSAPQFARMKEDAILINTARGGLVDSAALVDALRSNRIGGAAIDVLSTEPPTGDDPLLGYAGDNLLLTPHIAWAGAQSRQRAIDALAENARAFMEGRRLNRVV